jgi:hypothetical protein
MVLLLGFDRINRIDRIHGTDPLKNVLILKNPVHPVCFRP